MFDRSVTPGMFITASCGTWPLPTMPYTNRDTAASTSIRLDTVDVHVPCVSVEGSPLYPGPASGAVVALPIPIHSAVRARQSLPFNVSDDPKQRSCHW